MCGRLSHLCRNTALGIPLTRLFRVKVFYVSFVYLHVLSWMVSFTLWMDQDVQLEASGGHRPPPRVVSSPLRGMNASLGSLGLLASCPRTLLLQGIHLAALRVTLPLCQCQFRSALFQPAHGHTIRSDLFTAMGMLELKSLGAQGRGLAAVMWGNEHRSV